MASTSIIKLSRSGESAHLCLVSQFSRSTTGWGREGEKRDTRGRFILCTEMQRKFHTALETALREKKNQQQKVLDRP